MIVDGQLLPRTAVDTNHPNPITFKCQLVVGRKALERVPAARPGSQSHYEEQASRLQRAAGLYAEGTAAAAGRLDVRVRELEPGAFQRLDVIHFCAIEIEQAGLVHEHL